MTKTSQARIYARLPRGYREIDPARSAKQARSLRASWPKDAGAIIVRSGPSRGKDKVVFPYHVASKKKDYW